MTRTNHPNRPNNPPPPNRSNRSNLQAPSRRRAKWTIALWSLLLVVAALLCLKLSFSTDYTIFFDEEDPERVALRELEDTFTQTDGFVFVVRPERGDVFDEEVLQAIGELSERAEEIPFARRVDSVATFPRTTTVPFEDDLSDNDGDDNDGDDNDGDDGESYEEEGELVVGAAAPPDVVRTEADRDALRAFASSETLLRGGLVSEDLRTAGVVVTLDLPRESPLEVREATAVARQLQAETAASVPGLDVRLSGMATMNDAFMSVSIADLALIIPLMFFCMLFVLFRMLGSAAATLAVSLVVAVSCAAAMALAALFEIPLTPPSASAATIVMTLAIADCVHVFVAARQAVTAGHGRQAAIREALKKTWRPVVLTSLTTVAGFLALNFAESLPIRHLGNMAAFGIGVALLASVTFFPAMLALLRIPPSRGDRGLFRWTAKLALKALDRPKTSIGIGLSLTLVCLGLMTQLRANEQFVNYFEESVPFREDSEFLLEHLSGLYTLEFVLDADAPQGVFAPDYVARVDAFAGWLRDQPEVHHVHAFSDVLRGARESFDGVHELPESREMAAQSLLLFELSLPAGADLRDRLDAERSRSRLTATVGDLSTEELRGFEERSERWLREQVGFDTQATSPVMIFSKLTERNTRAMIGGNIATLLAVSFFLLLVLRRRRLALASVLPNVAPMIIAYGLWALFVRDIGIVAAVAGSVCLGIIVDDTIHLLSRYERLREKLAPRPAMEQALSSVAPALVVTSLVLSLGFACLTLSSFQMNVHLGALSMMVILLALLGDLLILPSLVLFVERAHAAASSRSTSLPERNRPMTPTTRLLRFFTFLSIGLAAFCVALPGAQAQDAQGPRIAREVARRASGFGDFEASLSMTMQEGGTPRALRLRAKEADGGTHSLIIFDGPADVQGTALLSRQDGDDQQQWLWLPAARRARRIATGQLSASFLGSEFAYEDISGVSPSRYRWRHLGDGSCGEGSEASSCHRLEARPTFEGSGYDRRVVYVDTDQMRVQRVEYFTGGRHLKTLVHSDWRQHGRFWRAHRWEMTNHRTRARTIVTVGDYEFDKGFSDRDFSRGALARTR